MSGRGQTPLFFLVTGSEDEHVSEGGVWEGAPRSQAALLRLPSDGLPEERQPEEDVLLFSPLSTGCHQRENQR